MEPEKHLQNGDQHTSTPSINISSDTRPIEDGIEDPPKVSIWGRIRIKLGSEIPVLLMMAKYDFQHVIYE